MKLSDLIIETLSELAITKRDQNKKNYLVSEVLLELTISVKKRGSLGGELVFLKGGLNSSSSNTNRVVIKLTPRNFTNCKT